MVKQKVCIIGGGLTGLITAITLSKLNLKVDLIAGNIDQNIKSNRTIAVSQDNLNFLKKIGIFEYLKKEFWPCSQMKLYAEEKKERLNEIFELKKDKKQILYMTENSKIMNYLISKIKKEKKISFKTQNIISEIITSGQLKSIKLKNRKKNKYNLIILCTGGKSQLVKTIFKDETFLRPYNEISITTMIKHNFLQNNVARQIFFNNGILALLPLSNIKTAIVWSVGQNMKDKKKSFLRKNIKHHTKFFFKKIKFIRNIEYKELNLSIQKKYYQDRILLFGYRSPFCRSRI